MNEYSLFLNIKRWLITRDNPLLELFFSTIAVEETEPSKKYYNLIDDFDKHINLLAYYQTQVQPDLPLILVSFDDITGTSCFAKYIVTFDVYFTTIEPIDCRDDMVSVINSPESILGYQQLVNEALGIMICSMGQDLRHAVFDDVPWEYPLNYEVEQERYEPIHGVQKKELLHFQSSFKLSDNMSCC